MKRLLLPFTLALLAADLGASTVDLTPRYLDTQIDGIVARRLYFLEESKKIGICLDQETVVSAGGGGVVFKFPKVPDASFRIATSPFSPDEAMNDETSLERYRTSALSYVPGGATEIKVLEETTNPLPINRWQSHRFLISYQAGANVAKLSVTFLNVNPTTQLVLLTTASTRNWEEAAGRSFEIIRTWHEILPGDELASRVN